jgi:hypothetical protein
MALINHHTTSEHQDKHHILTDADTEVTANGEGPLKPLCNQDKHRFDHAEAIELSVGELYYQAGRDKICSKCIKLSDIDDLDRKAEGDADSDTASEAATDGGTDDDFNPMSV